MKKRTWLLVVAFMATWILSDIVYSFFHARQQDPITKTLQVTLEITPAVDFTPVVSPNTITSQAGRTVAYNVTAISVDGFVGDVVVEITNLPAGVTVSYFPSNTFPVSPGSSTGLQADITISSGADIGTFTLDVTYTSTNYN